jgi:hypothetical protein
LSGAVPRGLESVGRGISDPMAITEIHDDGDPKDWKRRIFSSSYPEACQLCGCTVFSESRYRDAHVRWHMALAAGGSHSDT